MAEIVQQQPAMRRRIRADALEARQISPVEPRLVGLAVLGDNAIVEHAASRRDNRRGAEPELGALAQPDLAIIEHRVGTRKRAAARLGDQRGAHAQRRRPARVDRQHGLDEVLVERRAAQDAAAARMRSAPPPRARCRATRQPPAPGPTRPTASAAPGAAARACRCRQTRRRRPRDCADRAAHRQCADDPADPFGAGEPAALPIPMPRRELRPAVAHDGEPQVDRPGKTRASPLDPDGSAATGSA